MHVHVRSVKNYEINVNSCDSQPINMPYTQCAATVSDARDLAIVFQKAFEHDHIMSFFHRHSPKDLVLERDTKLFTRGLEEGSAFGKQFTKIVDDSTGQIVAFAQWEYPFHLTPELEAKKEKRAEEWKKEPHPPGAELELINNFMGQLETGRKKFIDPEKTYCTFDPQCPTMRALTLALNSLPLLVVLHILAVLPEHQGKGLGRTLIQRGLEEADEAGAKTYIEASPAGLPVYMKYGWEVVDDLAIDMRPYGGNGVEHNPCLLREPGAGNAKALQRQT